MDGYINRVSKTNFGECVGIIPSRKSLNVSDLFAYHRRLPDIDEADACNVSGKIKVKRVAGSFHITAIGHGHGGDHAPHEGLFGIHVLFLIHDA